MDRFLQDLSKYYEIVLFSPSNFGVVDPITWTLDKQGLIMHRCVWVGLVSLVCS